MLKLPYSIKKIVEWAKIKMPVNDYFWLKPEQVRVSRLNDELAHLWTHTTLCLPMWIHKLEPSFDYLFLIMWVIISEWIEYKNLFNASQLCCSDCSSICNRLFRIDALIQTCSKLSIKQVSDHWDSWRAANKQNLSDIFREKHGIGNYTSGNFDRFLNEFFTMFFKNFSSDYQLFPIKFWIDFADI